jgi:hypothetical protein
MRSVLFLETQRKSVRFFLSLGFVDACLNWHSCIFWNERKVPEQHKLYIL